VVWTLALQPESGGPTPISGAAWLLQSATWPPFRAFVAHGRRFNSVPEHHVRLMIQATCGARSKWTVEPISCWAVAGLWRIESQRPLSGEWLPPAAVDPSLEQNAESGVKALARRVGLWPPPTPHQFGPLGRYGPAPGRVSPSSARNATGAGRPAPCSWWTWSPRAPCSRTLGARWLTGWVTPCSPRWQPPAHSGRRPGARGGQSSFRSHLARLVRRATDVVSLPERGAVSWQRCSVCTARSIVAPFLTFIRRSLG
jgi:hypothetical protein